MKLGDKDVEEGVSDEHDLSGGSERGEGFTAVTNMDIAENVLYIYDALHPGYVHASNKKFFDRIDSASVREQCLQNSKFIESSQEGGSITGPSYSRPSAGGTFTVNRDFVYGLRCESWPSQAEEWTNETDHTTGRAQRADIGNISPGLPYRTSWLAYK
ncbi:hypothetical protein OS493_038633 [Desmophyllum pertusum]|uniref:Uncharacterized protein n=1 Tax=Desmophyllum pertusum TaxID=174260 RepID=A0A9X0D144_9CNID|nr:hypothetical protein OS493_038633 [Desmophyllum pertusum]